MFRDLFGNPADGSRERSGAASGVTGGSRADAPAIPPRGSGAFAGVQKVPAYTLIVVIPADHVVSLERIATRKPRRATSEVEVIVACAGQPAHATVAAIHAHLRSAQFLLAPSETHVADLRALAMQRATGDIVAFVDGVASSVTSADRGASHARISDPDPALSIIVPAHNGGALLEEALAAIVSCDTRRDKYELIVVDDASTDDSLQTAARYADTIVRLKAHPRGAAYARNRGADQARGDVLAFVDADVRVRRDTFSQLLATFAGDPLVCAVSASCDGTSGDGGVPTQYWNLLRQFGAHVRGGVGIHFDAACGAVRRAAFVASGMFNEWTYDGASVEALDLGSRLTSRTGHRVLLRGDISVAHLRPHSIGGVVAGAWRRSLMLTRTLGYGATRPLARSDIAHTLNATIGVASAGTVALVGIAAFYPSPTLIVASAVALAAVLAANAEAIRFFARRRGLTFAIAATALHVTAQTAASAGRCAGWILRNVVGDPSPDATTQAFAEVGVEIWPPVPRKP